MFKIKFNTQKIKYFISGVVISGLLTSTIAFADPGQFILQKSVYPMIINGTNFNSNSPILNYEGSTYIPLKDVGSLLHCDVKWNNELKRIEISQINQVQEESKIDGKKDGAGGSSTSVDSNVDKYSSSKPINTQVQQTVQETQETQIAKPTQTQVQPQVQQNNSEYEVLKDYPIPEGSSGKPIKYNGSIYFPLRLGAEIYGINFSNININDQNNTVIFPNNASIELNNSNSITYQYRLYLREDIFSNNNNNE